MKKIDSVMTELNFLTTEMGIEIFFCSSVVAVAVVETEQVGGNENGSEILPHIVNYLEASRNPLSAFTVWGKV